MYWSSPRLEDAIGVLYRLPDDQKGYTIQNDSNHVEKLHDTKLQSPCRKVTDTNLRCSQLLSRWNLVDEIDSYFCPQCVESLPSTEAMAYRSCCFRCFNCPRCQHVLTFASNRLDGAKEKEKETETPTLSEAESKILEQPTKEKQALQRGTLSPGSATKIPSPQAEKSKSPIRSTQRPVAKSSTKALAKALRIPPKTGKAYNANISPKIQPETPPTQNPAELTAPQPEFRLVCQFCHWNSSHLPFQASKLEQIIDLLTKAHREAPAARRLSKLSTALMRSALDSQKDRSDVPATTWVIQDNKNDNSQLIYSSGLNSPELGNKLNRNEMWKLTQELVDEKQKKLETFSIWDLQIPGLKELIEGTEESFGICIPAQKFLNWRNIPSKRLIMNLKASIDITDLQIVPSQDQRLLTPENGSLCTVDQLLPTPKPLLTKRSRRCGTCKRYLVRTQVNPSAPFRLNNTAINFLPRIILIGLLPLNLSEFTLQPDVEGRFPRLEIGQQAYLDFELANMLDGIAANLSFKFLSHSGDTLEITTPDFQTTIAGYDEFLEDDEGGSRASFQENIGAIRDRRHYKLRLRFQVKVKESIAPLSVAKCSFNLKFVPDSSFEKIELKPVGFRSGSDTLTNLIEYG